jgi:hypothetical protein
MREDRVVSLYRKATPMEEAFAAKHEGRRRRELAAYANYLQI